MATAHDTAEVAPQRAYYLRGITYLPHYSTHGLFVAPGSIGTFGKTFTKAELVEAGAVKVAAMLWPRPLPRKSAAAA